MTWLAVVISCFTCWWSSPPLHILLAFSKLLIIDMAPWVPLASTNFHSLKSALVKERA